MCTEKATSELLPAGSGDIAHRRPMRTLKRRMDHKNPNVQLLALNVGVVYAYGTVCSQLTYLVD